ncbi:hypothetical protein PPERSA_01644 [Pseudocohnilembus persalinus]|uniref:Uncharacterized protein n=1 Tax=Pseudocohnilembus persalinus TaxID=266149 RepID=A0A0V0R4M8_PSEPJ|nr:hypothetical protein PPERSA_01644 [Pseudocohnilembus persalinus]|eukprot:KRX09444.1 hypothetical protein PPERSA_01644 [Pseudocohnilembus persalinus]
MNCNIHQDQIIVAINFNKIHDKKLFCQNCLIEQINLSENYNNNQKLNLVKIEDLFENKNEQKKLIDEIEQYPFDEQGKNLKNLLKKLQSLANNQMNQEMQKQMINYALNNFEKNINQQIQSLKKTIFTYFQNYNYKKNFENVQQLYNDNYDLQELQQTLNSNKNEQKLEGDIDNFTINLEHKIKDFLTKKNQNQQQNFDIVNEQLKESQKLFGLKNIQQQLEKINSEFYNITSKLLRIYEEKKENIPLQKSEVGLPDAYNTILYSQEQFSEIKLRLNFLKTLRKQQDCHFFVGLMKEEFKDKLGYNHDLPCICLSCNYDIEEVEIEQKLLDQNNITQFTVYCQNQVIYQDEIQNQLIQQDQQSESNLLPKHRIFINFSQDNA